MQYLIGIGAQKAGTTWLYQYFNRHPQVAASPIKELHFFDQAYRNDLCDYFLDNFQKQLNFLNNKSKKETLSPGEVEKADHLEKRIEIGITLESYREYLETLPCKDQSVVTEITPSYSMLNADGFSAIKNTLPGAKIVFLMRDPVSRYWSHLRFHQMMNPGFEPLDHVESFLENQDFWERTDYRKTIQELESVFQAEDICYAFYEHLFSENKHARTLKTITAFIDVEYREATFKKAVNQSIALDLPKEKTPLLRDAFSPIYNFVEDRFGTAVPENWLTD
jgi:hypothetical protein